MLGVSEVDDDPRNRPKTAQNMLEHKCECSKCREKGNPPQRMQDEPDDIPNLSRRPEWQNKQWHPLAPATPPLQWHWLLNSSMSRSLCVVFILISAIILCFFFISVGQAVKYTTVKCESAKCKVPKWPESGCKFERYGIYFESSDLLYVHDYKSTIKFP